MGTCFSSGQDKRATNIFITIYKFNACDYKELCLRKGEHLEILNHKEGDRWLPRNKKNKRKGYIPLNYFDGSEPLEAALWYFPEMTRIEAEKKLLLPEYKRGAFIIRGSKTYRNDFALSLKDENKVRHYVITKLNEKCFFMYSEIKFNTLQELVNHYSKRADGLPVRLRKPCE